jgi:hypothetical protein
MREGLGAASYAQRGRRFVPSLDQNVGRKDMQMSESTLQRIKRYDEQRPGFPGEHWLVLAAGVGAWLATRRHPSILVKTLGMAAGTALVARAASGRDGLAKVLRYTPLGGGIRRL